jgi:hypothetical protein
MPTLLTRRNPAQTRRSVHPGEVLLVAAGERHSTLWRLEDLASRARNEAGVCYEFGVAADEAWREAVALLPRVSPLLWKHVGRKGLDSRQARRIGSWALPNWSVPFDSQLEGSSFGLSFLLALASEAFGVAVPEHFAASAVLGSDSRLSPVEGLVNKVAVLVKEAPWVRTLLVAENQPDVRRCRYTYPSVVIRPVENARTALDVVFENAMAVSTLEAAPNDRSRLIANFLRLALEADHTVTDWKPFARAVDSALTKWAGSISPHDVHTLRFVGAVFDRRRGGSQRLELDEQWLGHFAAPVRLAVLRKLVLHSAATGSPPPTQVEAIARAALPAVSDAHNAHLRLESALGRLLSVTGRPEDAQEAQETQERVVSAFFDRFRHDQAGEALAECYRLATAMEDPLVLPRIEEQFLLMQAFGGCDPRVVPLLETERSIAHVRLTPDCGQLAGAHLAHLRITALDSGLHRAISYSALRAYVHWSNRSNRSADGVDLVNQVLGPPCEDNEANALATSCRALIELDNARDSGDSSTVQANIRRLENLHPGLASNFAGVGGGSEELFARWYVQ